MNSQEDNANNFKGISGIKRVINATGYSIAGIKAAFKGEAAFRQLVLMNVILIPIALSLQLTHIERLLMILSCVLTLVIELLNSAIEATVDRISLELHPLSKQAKDMGSAAQFIGLVIVSITWGCILLNSAYV